MFVLLSLAILAIMLTLTACGSTEADVAQASQHIRDQPITLDQTRFVLLKLGQDTAVSIVQNVTLYREDWTVIPSKDDVKPGETIIVGKTDVTKTGYVAIIQSEASTTEYTAVISGTGSCPLWTKSVKHCDVLPTEFIVGDRDHNLFAP